MDVSGSIHRHQRIDETAANALQPPEDRVLRRILVTVVAAAVLAGGIQLATAGPASATPPGVPSVTTARSELATLSVAAWTHTTTYNRALFPTWDTISGTCNTRETVLKRDGKNVVVNSACSATSGSWYSPYDGETWTADSDVDNDHDI